MAFALPCCAIVLCYARIFYIVRKTALKLQENHSKENGSVRLSKKSNLPKRNEAHNQTPPSQKSSEERNDSLTTNQNVSALEASNGNRTRKLLSKSRDDDLKFIDTSVESDLPPTLSQLQRKSVQILIDHSVIDQLDTLDTKNEQELINSHGNHASTSAEPSTSSATDIPFDQNALK